MMQTAKPLDGDHCMLQRDIVLRFSPSRSVPPKGQTPSRSVDVHKSTCIKGRIAQFGKKGGYIAGAHPCHFGTTDQSQSTLTGEWMLHIELWAGTCCV